MKKMEIAAIGKVRADDAAGSYLIEIHPDYRDGLEGLDKFGRVQVLWWAHGVDEEKYRSRLSCELPYAPGTRAGVFACRAEYRPNPIDITSCGIIEIRKKEGILILDYIDAVDGTPVLDLKPYIPVCDRAREIKVPEWFRSWPEWIEDSGAFFSNPDAPRTSCES